MSQANPMAEWLFKVELSHAHVTNLHDALVAHGLTHAEREEHGAPDHGALPLPRARSTAMLDEAAPSSRPRCMLRFAFDGLVRDIPLVQPRRSPTARLGEGARCEEAADGEDETREQGGGFASGRHVWHVMNPPSASFVYRIRSPTVEELVDTLGLRFATVQVLLVGAADAAGTAAAAVPDGHVVAILGSSTVSLLDVLAAKAKSAHVFDFDLAPAPEAGLCLPAAVTSTPHTESGRGGAARPEGHHVDSTHRVPRRQAGDLEEGVDSLPIAQDADAGGEFLRSGSGSSSSSCVAGPSDSRACVTLTMAEVRTVSVALSHLVLRGVSIPPRTATHAGGPPVGRDVYVLRYHLVASVGGATAADTGETGVACTVGVHGVTATGTPLHSGRPPPPPLCDHAAAALAVHSCGGDGEVSTSSTGEAHLRVESAEVCGDGGGGVVVALRAEEGLPPLPVRATCAGLARQWVRLTLLRRWQTPWQPGVPGGERAACGDGGTDGVQESVLRQYELPLGPVVHAARALATTASYRFTVRSRSPPHTWTACDSPAPGDMAEDTVEVEVHMSNLPGCPLPSTGAVDGLSAPATPPEEPSLPYPRRSARPSTLAGTATAAGVGAAAAEAHQRVEAEGQPQQRSCALQGQEGTDPDNPARAPLSAAVADNSAAAARRTRGSLVGEPTPHDEAMDEQAHCVGAGSGAVLASSLPLAWAKSPPPLAAVLSPGEEKDRGGSLMGWGGLAMDRGSDSPSGAGPGLANDDPHTEASLADSSLFVHHTRSGGGGEPTPPAVVPTPREELAPPPPPPALCPAVFAAVGTGPPPGGPTDGERRRAAELCAAYRHELDLYTAQVERARRATDVLARLDADSAIVDGGEEMAWSGGAPDAESSLAAVEARLESELVAARARLRGVEERMTASVTAYEAGRLAREQSSATTQKALKALQEAEGDLNVLLADAETQWRLSREAHDSAAAEARCARDEIATHQAARAELGAQLVDRAQQLHTGCDAATPTADNAGHWTPANVSRRTIPVEATMGSGPLQHMPIPSQPLEPPDVARPTAVHTARRLSLVPSPPVASPSSDAVPAPARVAAHAVDWRHLVPSPLAGRPYAEVSSHPYAREPFQQRPPPDVIATAAAGERCRPRPASARWRLREAWATPPAASCPSPPPLPRVGMISGARLRASAHLGDRAPHEVRATGGRESEEAPPPPAEPEYVAVAGPATPRPLYHNLSMRLPTTGSLSATVGTSEVLSLWPTHHTPVSERGKVLSRPWPDGSSGGGKSNPRPASCPTVHERGRTGQRAGGGESADSAAEPPIGSPRWWVEYEALTEALRSGDTRAAEFLLRAKPYLALAPGSSLLHVACESPQGASLPIVEALLRLRPEMVHERDARCGGLSGGSSSSSSSGNTPLHCACAATRPSLAVVKALLLAGARTDVRNAQGHTPFHAAVLNPADEPRHLVKDALLAFATRDGGGVSVNARTAGGQTPLHLVCGSDANMATVHYLLARGADLWARAPLHDPLTGGRGHEMTPMEQSRALGAMAVYGVLEAAALEGKMGFRQEEAVGLGWGANGR